jgi:hypothetical protein
MFPWNTALVLCLVKLLPVPVMAHDRRRILHCNGIKHPTSAWVIQQLRNAFPYDSAPGYLIFDRSASIKEAVFTVKIPAGEGPENIAGRFAIQARSQCFGPQQVVDNVAL